MKVSRTEVVEVLDAVIDGRLPRENVEAWAQRRIDALDSGSLVFVPPELEARLWEVISVLQTIGAKSEAGVYVTTRHDLAEVRARAVT
jgi:hypothetical protein